MTRFARARGSKSSNEKAPEDSTPWEVMKEQLIQAKKDSENNKKRQEAENQRIENYENFLKEQKVQKRAATWCDFPETKVPVNENPKKKKKKVTCAESQEVSHGGQSNVNVNKEIKKSKKKTDKVNVKEEQLIVNEENEQNSSSSKPKKKNKKNNASVVTNLECRGEQSKDSPNNHKINKNSGNEKPGSQLKGKKNKKFKDSVDGKSVRRKPINDKTFQLIINGKEVVLERFDGFPVMKKDAERLSELKGNMIKKGIPKNEVQRTIKLERRRAEKALARLRREVCYNCRKGGHNLSDCPDLKSKIPGADHAEGICFKCGSTEHRQFECKVQRDSEFRFANCFICKQQGHIARQCPDNPKGLYPNGGSCKLCGDVTHLRKDCPTVKDVKQESSVKLHTLDASDNLEDLGQQQFNTGMKETFKKPKKIKF